MKSMIKKTVLLATLAAALAGPARAQLSEASALSALPAAVSVAAPVALLSAGAMFTVVAVDASAHGAVWLLERASDGVRASVTVAGGVSVAAGATLVVSTVAAGWVLSAAGRAVAFIPNEVGKALLYNERIR